MHIGITEIIIIALIVLLLFGGKKIPELMKGLGKGVKSFKDGMKEGDEEMSSKEEGSKEMSSKEMSNKEVSNKEMSSK
jgi:sec-independent protein translocase protein TatA